jgi:cysteine synthase
LGSLKYAELTGQDNILTILCDRGERYLSCL